MTVDGPETFFEIVQESIICVAVFKRCFSITVIINAPRHYSSVWFYATLDFLTETDLLLLKLKEDVGM